MPTALISVANKHGIKNLARALDEKEWWLFTTPGSENYIRGTAGIRTIPVEMVTGFAPVFGGQVKTFHPNIFGGLIARKRNEKEANDKNIHLIDMLVVNFVSLWDCIENDKTEEECIDSIDIAGPALVQAAAKNFERVTVIVDPNDYKKVIDEVSTHGNTLQKTRNELALKASKAAIEYQISTYHWLKSKFNPLPSTVNPNADLYAGGKRAKKS